MNRWTRTHSTVAAVIGCHALIVAIGLTIGGVWPRSVYHEAAREIVRGATAALAVLLVAWATFGRLRLRGWGDVRWLAAFCLLIIACGSVEEAFDHFNDPQNRTPAMSPGYTGPASIFLLIASLGVVARFAAARGWRWVHDEREDGATPRFALREAFVATLALAALFAIAKTLHAWIADVETGRAAGDARWNDRLGLVGLEFAGLACLAYHAVSVAAVAGPRPRLSVVAAAVGFAGVAGLTMRWLLPTKNLAAPLVYAAGATTSAALTIAYLLAFRAVGWRIDRALRSPSERKPAATPDRSAPALESPSEPARGRNDAAAGRDGASGGSP